MGEERRELPERAREGAVALWARARDLSGTVRVRATAGAVVAVGAVLVVASVAMVGLLRGALTDDVEASVLLRAEVVEHDLEQQGLHGGVPVPVIDPQDEFVQVLDPSTGFVVASSRNVRDRGVVKQLRPDEVATVHGLSFEKGEDADENAPFLLVATDAETPDGESVIVIAGGTLESVTESSETAIGLLIAGVPLVVAFVGFVTWRVVGRALAPVESIRSEVESISTKELHRRVPFPSGKDEISRLATTMNRMLGRLESGQARQRRFVSDASHELRSPVTTIRHHAEVALAHPDGTSMEELAAVVLEEDARLQRLVEELLLLAKIDEGTLRLRMSPVDLDDIVFEEAERMRRTTPLKVDTTGVSAGRVTGNKGQLENLLQNLFDNAARHARGEVVLHLLEQDSVVVLSIDDDGEGIPEDERQRVFERFVRLDEARDRDSGGSGLGLAIVSEIAAAHGATVAVLEAPAGGVRFEVRFPSARD